MSPRNNTFTLTRRLAKYMVKYYPYVPEAQLVAKTGLDKLKIRLCARRLGLRKHPDYLSAIRSGRYMLQPDDVPQFKNESTDEPLSNGNKKQGSCMWAYCRGNLSRMHDDAIIKKE